MNDNITAPKSKKCLKSKGLWLAKGRMILSEGWPRASWAGHQTEFNDNGGEKLSIKFGGSQGAQDVKTTTSYWQNNICFASN